MIPTIEQIIEDLLAGVISKSQAITWLNAHAEGAANDLRDHFAAMALQGMLAYPGDTSSGSHHNNNTWSGVASIAYEYADAMLKARES